jgi:phosphate starvation-inducible protein PhoH and related proteins
MSEVAIDQIAPQLILPLFGARDQHLRRLRDFFQVDIVHKNGSIVISGPEEKVQQAAEVLQRLKRFVEKHGGLTPEAFDQTMKQVTGVWTKEAAKPVETSNVGATVRPRTPGQAEYLRQIRQNDLTFAVGPAGSGKTYLAVALAIEALRAREVRKIVLVRPAVEAGESLGFLPGDLLQKIQPYLRPLMDAINELMGFETGQRLLQSEVIEVLPLAYMRGRTLNDAFIILDEAQNTTVAQMKMFLTRMGNGSKIVVAGDTTQIDLPRGINSGLFDALHRLKQVKGIAFARLTEEDIVRHPLVQKIVSAYETISERDPTRPRT